MQSERSGEKDGFHHLLLTTFEARPEEKKGKEGEGKRDRPQGADDARLL